MGLNLNKLEQKVDYMLNKSRFYHCPKCGGVAYKIKNQKRIKCLEDGCNAEFNMLSE